jgi:TolB protein
MATALVFPPAVDAAFPGRDGLIAFTRAAAWSPDGRRIAFSAAGRDSVHVYVKGLGGGVRKLTHGDDTFTDPTWSPDGRRIAAVRGHWAQDGLHYDSLVVMRADGRRRHTVYGGRQLSSSYPAWSPDGRSIAFVHTDIGGTGADPNIYVVPAGGGTARQVTDVGSQDHPDWSPDGSLLAYTWGAELSPDDIRVVRPDRTGDAPVTDDPSSDGWPVWSPSGRRLAISRLGRIWTLAPDGSGLKQLTRGRTGVSDWDPSWQPR